MMRCPNCGQRTSGGDCQWCKYPILKGRQKEAEAAAREKAKQEVEEARRAKEAEKQAKKKEAEAAAREKAKQEAEKAKEAKEAVRALSSQIDLEQAKHLEECLKEMESIHEELRAGKIGTGEAIQKLRDIAERMSK